jgi:hypothetical protein
LKDRVPTASERIYSEFLAARTKRERARLEGQLVAICIVACRRRRIAPPYERDMEFESEHRKRRWVGGPRSLLSWVRGWVYEEVDGEPLKDGARYIGRRCVNALVDEIRWHERRKRGAQERFRAWQLDDGLAERQWSRNKVRRAFTKFGLPRKLAIAGDRELFERLIAEYPKRLTNVAIARTLGVTEAAVRKRRKRISQFCLEVVKDPNLLTIAFKQLGLRHGYEKSA